LQLRISDDAGHTEPPCRGALVVRARVWEPPPQLDEQAVHVPQVATVQSAGHGALLHPRLSELAGH
jgi:hypothetical protein